MNGRHVRRAGRRGAPRSPLAHDDGFTQLSANGRADRACCCGNIPAMRLLVVEDETNIAASVKKGLVENGYSVDVAPNQVDGLHLATHEAYEALIVDRRLPDGDGLEIIRGVRAAGA